MRYTTRWILMALAVLMCSCHSQKQSVATQYSAAPDAEIFENLAGEYNAYSDVYVPVSLTLQSPMEMSISGRATLVRDKLIHISLRMLGMEVAVVYVDTENLYLVDKFHKMYFTERLDRLMGDVPLTVGNMQDLLLGRAFVPGQSTITAGDAPCFTVGGDDRVMVLTPVKAIKGADWHYVVSRTTPPLLSALDVTVGGTAVECVYSSQLATPAGDIARRVTITAPVGGREARMTIAWDADGAKWDSGRQVTFSTPGSNYRAIGIEALMKALGQQ